MATRQRRPTKQAVKKATQKSTKKKAGRRVANKKVATPAKKATVRKQTVGDVPSLFRINVEVGNLDEAAEFYGKLFGVEGRKQAGSRCYFTCGPVTLQVVDVSSVGQPHPAAKALYFLVNNLDAVFERAQSLGCLSSDDVHSVSGGEISVRPWGERSFYAQDMWNNPLCFVEAGTVYPG
jgi:predicted enzyme related to lactoylglutathione lyase